MNPIDAAYEKVMNELGSVVEDRAELFGLARRAGLNPSTIRKIANRSSDNPTKRVLSALYEALFGENSIDTKNETAALKTHSRITTAPEHSSSEVPVHF